MNIIQLTTTSLLLTLSAVAYATPLESGTVERQRDRLVLQWENMPATGVTSLSWQDVETGKSETLTVWVSKDHVILPDPNPNRRTIFTVKDSAQRTVSLAERIIPAEKIDNLRDMGGYLTEDGKQVSWGKIYRSDLLTKLNNSGMSYFKSMNVGYNFDLRSDDEIAKKPDIQLSGLTYLHTEIPTAANPEPRPKTKEEVIEFYTSEKPLKFWVEANNYMVDSPKAQDTLKQVFHAALNSDGKALVWHCSGGKDRTGFVSAVFLSALGVPHDAIMQDYLATNEYRKEFDANEREEMKQVFGDNAQAMQGFLAIQEARPAFVDASLNKIKRDYGSVSNYLEKVIGLTPEQLAQLKALYTE